ncbi:MAG: hypothetical protein EOP07_24390, partial [Proteobacteria bacterium]
MSLQLLAFRLLLVLVSSTFLKPVYAAEVTTSQLVVTRSEVTAAIEGLADLNGFPADESLLAIVEKFYQLAPVKVLDQKAREDLLQKENIALWTGVVDEFSGLAEILFEDSSAKTLKQKEFDRYQLTLSKFKSSINSYVLSIHPGFQFLDMSKLAASHQGQAVTIAVFDVFDMSLLKEQQKRFPQATIDPVVSFGKPLSLSHGNVVIDIILRIAPAAHIVPVWADAKDYTKVMLYLQTRTDIDIVNMSRAFAEASDHQGIDPDFKKALKTFTKDRILTKALGNSGTNLAGQVTAKRQAEGLGPVNNLSSYDIKLVADTYSEGDGEVPDLLLFAINLSLFADDIALSATVPGDVSAIRSRSLGVPAEGVWSPS